LLFLKVLILLLFYAYNIKVLSDNWTAVTSDGSLSAHYEHTVAITDKGPWVLSRP
jgi:methionyl aminopeptidase